MKIRGLFDALSIGGIVLLAACGGMQSPISVPGTRSSAAGNFQNHHTFLYTGAAQSFVVPANTTLIKVVARGAGAGPKAYSRREPARGARVSALLPVRPGERLRVYVGGAGYSDESGNYSGGFNGGGNPGDRFGGLGGGGASDVREGGDALGFRILVAGGGGGSCGFHGGGLGGHGGGRAGARARVEPIPMARVAAGAAVRRPTEARVASGSGLRRPNPRQKRTRRRRRGWW